MGPGRGKGPVCPHLPGAEMLIWAHLCPFALPPTGDPPAGGKQAAVVSSFVRWGWVGRRGTCGAEASHGQKGRQTGHALPCLSDGRARGVPASRGPFFSRKLHPSLNSSL